MRGIVKADVVDTEPGYTNIILLSVFDKKPLHFTSTSTESITCIEKTKDIYSKLKNTLTLSCSSISISITNNI